MAQGPGPQGPGSGWSITALVLGIAAVVLCWIPFVGIIAAVVALVIGIVAWTRARSGRSSGLGLAIAGTIAAAVALALSIVLTVALVRIFGDLSKCIDPNLTQSQQQQCVNDVFGINPTPSP